MATPPRETAAHRIHRDAILGALFAALPLPITSAGLAAIEVRLGAFIAKTYGSPLSSLELAMGSLGLSVMGRGLKLVARGASKRLPAPFGLLTRMAIAAGTIEALGHGLVLLYEQGRDGARLSD
jgi:uncharacterized protein (DUF697 family)